MRTGTAASRVLATIVLTGFIPVASVGCFGPFELTPKIYRFVDDSSDDKWVKWIVFLPMSFFMSGAALLDGAVFNSVEFWTGENPVNSTGVTVEGPNGETAHLTPLGDGRIDVVVIGAAGGEHHLTLTRDDRGVTAFDAAGQFLARGEIVDGEPVLVRSVVRPL